MKTILLGAPVTAPTTFQLCDPDALKNETEFESYVVRALTHAFPCHRCILFAGTFKFDGDGRRPDLALIARDLSHWFIIEVELASHDATPDAHAMKQVRAFQYGEPQSDCLSILQRELGFDRARAESFLAHIPRSVVVVLNRRAIAWETALRATQAQLLVVDRYRSNAGAEVLGVEGTLSVLRESIAFGTFSATDRSFRFAPNIRLSPGRTQIVDPGGGLAWWLVNQTHDAIWLTKEVGTPSFSDKFIVQLIRTMDGQLLFRDPALKL